MKFIKYGSKVYYKLHVNTKYNILGDLFLELQLFIACNWYMILLHFYLTF